MLEDTTQTRDAISELASYGVRFSLDDFGVGYSSLGYIQSYPISTIKIDKKFIDNIDTDRTSANVRRDHRRGLRTSRAHRSGYPRRGRGNSGPARRPAQARTHPRARMPL